MPEAVLVESSFVEGRVRISLLKAETATPCNGVCGSCRNQLAEEWIGYACDTMSIGNTSNNQ